MRPFTHEDAISQIPALQVLRNLDYVYLTPEEALALRGGRMAGVLLLGYLTWRDCRAALVVFNKRNAKFSELQACCLNYNSYVKELFGEGNGIDKHLSFSLQFSTINTEQKDMLADHPELPGNIQSYVQDFDQALSEDEFNSQRYAYRILFVPKTANRKGQADKVIEFVKSDTPLAEEVNKAYAVIKETEKPKYLPVQIVEMMQEEGFSKFNMHHHTTLWKKEDAKNPSKGFGCMVADEHWHYYENWVETVRNHCREHRRDYV